VKVYVKYEAYRTMMLASRYASPYEIAGLLYGTVDSRITVEEADVFKIQSVTASSVDISPKEFAEHAAQLDSEHVKKVIGFWHSHGSMSAFHSAIDVETSRLLVKQINPLITLTTNSRGELKAIIYAMIPKLNETLKIDAEVEIDIDEDEELRRRIERMRRRVEFKQRKKSKAPWPAYDYIYSGYGYAWQDGESNTYKQP
jgi:proteasome lid subunit RPN8/RPN11